MKLWYRGQKLMKTQKVTIEMALQIFQANFSNFHQNEKKIKVTLKFSGTNPIKIEVLIYHISSRRVSRADGGGWGPYVLR